MNAYKCVIVALAESDESLLYYKLDLLPLSVKIIILRMSSAKQDDYSNLPPALISMYISITDYVKSIKIMNPPHYISNLFFRNYYNTLPMIVRAKKHRFNKLRLTHAMSALLNYNFVGIVEIVNIEPCSNYYIAARQLNLVKHSEFINNVTEYTILLENMGVQLHTVLLVNQPYCAHIRYTISGDNLPISVTSVELYDNYSVPRIVPKNIRLANVSIKCVINLTNSLIDSGEIPYCPQSLSYEYLNLIVSTMNTVYKKMIRMSKERVLEAAALSALPR
jgi:hypothetical protein